MMSSLARKEIAPIELPKTVTQAPEGWKSLKPSTPQKATYLSLTKEDIEKIGGVAYCVNTHLSASEANPDLTKVPVRIQPETYAYLGLIRVKTAVGDGPGRKITKNFDLVVIARFYSKGNTHIYYFFKP